MARRFLVVILSILAVLVGIVAGGAALLAWRTDLAKGPLENLASDMLGRTVRVAHIDLDLGRTLTARVEGLEVEAPEWARAPLLASAERITLGLDAVAWLAGEGLRIPALRLEQPRLFLERDAQGRTSWPEQQEQPQEEQAGSAGPDIGDLVIESGLLGYRDAVSDVAIETSVVTRDETAGPEKHGGLELEGTGEVRGREIELALEVGSPLKLRGGDAPFPVEGLIVSRDMRVRIDGSAADALALEGVRLAVEASAEDPRDLLALLRRPVGEELPALAVSATLIREEGVVGVQELDARWGESRLEGSLSYDPTGARTAVAGELRSPFLDLVALQPVMQAATPEAADPQEQNEGDPLEAVNLNLDLAAERVRLPGIGLHDIKAGVRLEDGRLAVDPLEVGLPEGRIAGSLVRAPGEDAVAGVDLAAEQVALGPLAGEAVGGILSGHLDGKLEGADLASILERSTLRFDGTLARPRLPRLAERLEEIAIDATLTPAAERPLRVVLESAIAGEPLALELAGGAPAILLDGKGSYPLMAELTLGQTAASLEGSIPARLTAGEIALGLRIEGPDPAPVLALLDLPAMQLPPYRLSGRIAGEEGRWEVGGLEGQVGDTTVTGDLSVDVTGERPKVSGSLRSPVLDLDDLGGLVGAEPGTGPDETASRRQQQEARQEDQDKEILPDDRFDPERWRQLDLDLALSAKEVRAGDLPLDEFDLAVRLAAGRLTVDPLKLRLGEGTAEGRVELDASRTPAVASLDLDLRRLPIGRLFERLDIDTAAFGTLSGRARGGADIGGRGMSIEAILAGGDGAVTLLMEGGAVNRQIVNLLGFDFLGLFGSLLGTQPEMVGLNCTLVDLELEDGVLRTRSLVIDTEIADLAGEGTIDLDTEQIDVELLARPDSAPLPGGRTGITIAGTLASPEVKLDAVTLAARGAMAATFGTFLRPFTGLASAIAGRTGEESPCGPVLEKQEENGG